MLRSHTFRRAAALTVTCLAVILPGAARQAAVAADPMPARGAAAPLQATTQPTAGATQTPMPTATPCTGERWRIQVHVFPDDVGAGVRWPPRQPLHGCDGFFTDGDRLAATGHMIDPVWVVVTNASGTAILDSKVFGRWGANFDATNLFTLCEPPPYVVQLVTVHMRDRVLCPNQPNKRLLTDAHFTAGLLGRLALVRWGFVEANP